MEEGEGKRDPYNQKAIWENWETRTRNGRIEGVSVGNSTLIKAFLHDMEIGRNVAPGAKKGARSYVRLNALRHRMIFMARAFPGKKLDRLTEREVHEFFSKLRRGNIKRDDGKNFRAVGTIVKDFKVFWHYLMRVGRVKADITRDLSRADAKPPWVYLTEDQFRTLANSCRPDYRALAWFLYDSMARVTEAYSIRVSDFNKDFTAVEIRSEVAKTFGRKFKLKLSSQLISEYVAMKDLGPEDYLFVKKPAGFNKYLRRLAGSLFGDGVSPARSKYSQFTLYDIRHNATCFWLMRYPQRKGVMYRGGWTKESQLNYYSEFLGLSDQLTDEDMVTAEQKTVMQREI